MVTEDGDAKEVKGTMDLPVIDTPVFPRWVWMEEITYSHIPIATLITAFMLLAPLFEYIG